MSGRYNLNNAKRCPLCHSVNAIHLEYCLRCSHEFGELAEARHEHPFASFSLSRVLVGAIVLGGGVVFASLRNESDSPSAAVDASPETFSPVHEVAVDTPESEVLIEIMNRGLEVFKREDFEAAAAYFESAIRELPDSTTAHQYLGLSRYWLADYDGAIATLEHAREIHPDSREILDHFVTVAKELDDLKGAADALESYINSHRADDGARLELARIARDRLLPHEALEQSRAPDA